jgi:hypothetical protein
VGEGDKEEILQKRSTVEQAITLSTWTLMPWGTLEANAE